MDHPTPPPTDLPPLHPDDAQALDALLADRGGRTEPAPPQSETPARDRILPALLGLLDRGWSGADLDAPTGLADRTAARVAQHRFSTPALRPTGAHHGWRIGLRQAGAVAAVLLVGLSLLIPVMSKVRADAQAAHCRANLAKTGAGLAQFASDRQGEVPTASRFGPTFGALSAFVDDTPGDAAATSAIHLLTLPREGYLRAQQLTCSAAAPTLVMGGLYSTQAVQGTRALRLPTLTGPVMADTNPLYALQDNRLVRLPGWDKAASQNHRGSGQNVLLADGSVVWALVPAVEAHDLQDNIWTHTDRADTGRDAFLVP